MSAKKRDVSFAAIIIAVVWVMLLLVCRAFVPVFFGGTQIGLSMVEIIAGGVFIVVAFSPVYRSIWLDKKLGLGVGESASAASDTEEGAKYDMRGCAGGEDA